MEVDTQLSNATPLYKLESLFKRRHGNRITLEDMKAEVAEARERFRAGFRKALENANIPSTQQIVLKSEPDGRVTVASDHPDKARIEAVLRNDPKLVNEFHRMDATATLVARAEETIRFQKAYAIDPRAAVARYSYLFDSRSEEDFSLAL